MKFRSTSLNNNGLVYCLVKYNEKYREYLDMVKLTNPDIAECLVQYPKKYSEQSQEQSYLILRCTGDYVGAVVIGTSTDEKNLEVKLTLNEKYFMNDRERSDFLEQLVDSLKLFFFDKENIEIELSNNAYENYFLNNGYEKKVYDANLTTYTISNDTNNAIVSKIVEEMNNVSHMFPEKYIEEVANGFNMETYEADRALLKDIASGKATLPEILCKYHKILWSDNKSKKIEFYNDGDVLFSKKDESKSVYGDILYFLYNVLRSSFKITFNTNSLQNKEFKPYSDNDIIEVENASDTLVIKCINKFYFKKYKKNNCIEFRYKHHVRNYSFDINIGTNEEGKVTEWSGSFKVFYTYGCARFFYFWINESDKTLYVSEYKIKDRTRENISLENVENLVALLDQDFTFETVCEFMKGLGTCIANKLGNDNILIEMNEDPLENYINIEEMVLEFVKQIKDEIPLPHWQFCLDKFLTEYSILEEKDKAIALNTNKK